MTESMEQEIVSLITQCTSIAWGLWPGLESAAKVVGRIDARKGKIYARPEPPDDLLGSLRCMIDTIDRDTRFLVNQVKRIENQF